MKITLDIRNTLLYHWRQGSGKASNPKAATVPDVSNPTREPKTMTDQAFDFQIDEGIAIPSRDIQGRPRGSQYPLGQMTPGQSFFVKLEGEEGATKTSRATGDTVELSAAEDLERKLRQKQSYFSQLAKKLGISVKTRTFEDGSEYSPKYAGTAGIGVWHNGERTEDEANDVGGDDE